MSRAALILIGLLAVGAWSPGLAATTRFTCPAKVHLESGRVADDLPAGVVASVDASALRLSGIGAFDGPPDRGGALMPTSSSRDDARSTWVFSGPMPDGGRWVSCDYAGGLVHVATRVDERAVSCEGVATKSGSPRILRAEFVCQ